MDRKLAATVRCLTFNRIGCLSGTVLQLVWPYVLHVRRLAADALEGKGKGQLMHGAASASAGGASREQSPLLDTLLPGYLSRPNPSPVKVRNWLQDN